MSSGRDLQVDITPLRTLSQLEALWRPLHDEAAATFYLSWPWIRTWLTTLPDGIECRTITIRSGSLIVALGLMVPLRLRRRRLIRSQTWTLHATGRPEFDCMFIEHNGLLVREKDEQRATLVLLDALDSQPWEELRFPGVHASFHDELKTKCGRIKEDLRLLSRYVDLNRSRVLNADYVQTLGPNTRARIRRTARDFEAKFGALQLQPATTLSEATTFFAELKTLHQRYWTGRGERGAFFNAHFETFHRALIGDFFAGGCIQLLRLTSGPRTVGVLYNFVMHGEVSMYQSGFDYSLIDTPNKQSPGLLMHALAIQHNADRGLKRYDFLGGDNQYKQVLANGSEELCWLRVQRDTLKFRAEDVAAACWRRLRARLQ